MRSLIDHLFRCSTSSAQPTGPLQAQRRWGRFGDAALTAFAAELGELTAPQIERLWRPRASKRCRWALLAGLAVMAVGPAVLFLLCPHRADCLCATARVGVWLAGGIKAGLVLSALSVLAWDGTPSG